MSDTHCRGLILSWVACIATGLTACSSFDAASKRVVTMVSPYRSDIVQGNVVTREQLSLLQPGMPRAQVRDILGTALLTSVFHADRWDYVFTLNQQGLPPQLRMVSLFFTGDVLDRIEADSVPSEAEFVATLKSKRPSKDIPVLEASEEMLKKFPAPAKRTPAPIPSTPVEYPLLEP